MDQLKWPTIPNLKSVLATYRTYFGLVIILAFLVELVIKSISANGIFSTQDEWVDYLRAVYVAHHFSFPAYEPFTIPPQPIVAPPGVAILMAVILMIPQTGIAVLTYVGTAIGGLTFVGLFFLSRRLFDSEKNALLIALGSLGFLVLSPPYLVRTQLFVGETIAFALFIVTIYFFVKQKFVLSGIFLISVGFVHEFVAFTAVFSILLSGIVYFLLQRNKRILFASLALFIVGIIPEGVLFFAQGPQLRISQVNSQLFPYPNVLSNLSGLANSLGLLLPLFGMVGLVLLARDIWKGKRDLGRIFLAVWYLFTLFFAIFPPFFASQIPIALWRTFDYYSMPAAILAAYSLIRLLEFRRPMLYVLMIVSSFGYSMVLNPGLDIAVLGNFDQMLGNGIALGFLIASVSILSLGFILFRIGKPHGNTKNKLIVIISGISLFILIINQAIYFSPGVVQQYTSYFSPNQKDFVASLQETTPPDSTIATNFVLASTVAGLSHRQVKSLPAYVFGSQDLLTSIENPNVYEEQFVQCGGAVPVLPFPIKIAEPMYYLAFASDSGRLFDTSTQLFNQVMADPRFTLISAVDQLYLFKVSLNTTSAFQSISAAANMKYWQDSSSVKQNAISTVSVSDGPRGANISTFLASAKELNYSIPAKQMLGNFKYDRGSGDYFNYSLSQNLTPNGDQTVKATVFQSAGQFISTYLDLSNYSNTISTASVMQFEIFVNGNSQQYFIVNEIDPQSHTRTILAENLTVGWNDISTIIPDLGFPTKNLELAFTNSLDHYFLISGLSFYNYQNSHGKTVDLSYQLIKGNSSGYLYLLALPNTLDLSGKNFFGALLYGDNSFEEFQLILIDGNHDWGIWTTPYLNWQGWKFLMYPLSHFDSTIGSNPNLSDIVDIGISITTKSSPVPQSLYYTSPSSCNLPISNASGAGGLHNLFVDQFDLLSLSNFS